MEFSKTKFFEILIKVDASQKKQPTEKQYVCKVNENQSCSCPLSRNNELFNLIHNCKNHKKETSKKMLDGANVDRKISVFMPMPTEDVNQ